MIGARLARGRLCTSDLVLAGGMAVSATLVAVVGGRLGPDAGVWQVLGGPAVWSARAAPETGETNRTHRP